jgi:hypothetical protein
MIKFAKALPFLRPQSGEREVGSDEIGFFAKRSPVGVGESGILPTRTSDLLRLAPVQFPLR